MIQLFFFLFYLISSTTNSKSRKVITIGSKNKTGKSAFVSDTIYQEYYRENDLQPDSQYQVFPEGNRLFLFVYLPGMKISKIIVDGHENKFSPSGTDFEMLSFDADEVIIFVDSSSSPSSLNGNADAWLIPRDICYEYSVGEFGGMHKQLNVTLLPSVRTTCLFSPRFNDLSTKTTISYGAVSAMDGSQAIDADIQLYEATTTSPYATMLSSSVQQSYEVTTAFLIRYALSAQSGQGKIQFTSDVDITNQESFYTSNCVARLCTYCNYGTCTTLNSLSISQSCSNTSPSSSSSSSSSGDNIVTPPTDPPSSSNSKSKFTSAGAIAGYVIAGLVVCAIVIVAVLLIKKSKVKSRYETSNPGYSLKTPPPAPPDFSNSTSVDPIPRGSSWDTNPAEPPRFG